ncbi:MAG: acyltransferase family protein [Thermoguttaceae bacterium]|jgi:predicted acyltransferase
MTNRVESTVPPIPAAKPPRLASLDALRGFDIFLLIFLDQIAHVFERGPGWALAEGTEMWRAIWRGFDWVTLGFFDTQILAEKSRVFFAAAMEQTYHTPWNSGFSVLDLIMPLFLFMAGAAIPFALAKYLSGERKRTCALWVRITRRVVVLWIFGMCVQGNLLSLDSRQFKLYSNTLQAIATGYLFSCIAYLYLPRLGRYALFVALLAAFWCINEFCGLNGCGLGSYEPNTNIAYEIDRVVLGRFRDRATLGANGVVEFNSGYHYTWLLSSLTFVATTLSGMFAGEFLYDARKKLGTVAEDKKKERRGIQYQAFVTLLFFGIAFVVLGKLWGMIPEGKPGYCPIIKYIWTPSMVLYSSGLSILLLAIFYLVYDIWNWRLFRTFLIVWGVNAIAAYMLSHLVHYGEFAGWFIYGLERFVGDWQETINYLVGAALLWLYLWGFWRRGKFLRV